MSRLTASKLKTVPFKVMLGLAAALVCTGDNALAASTTSTFQVQATIAASCNIVSTATLDFGSLGVLSTNNDQSTTLNVQCTASTPYHIGLDAGTGSGASVTTRKLTSAASATINYSLYTNAGRTTVWGNTVSTDTVDATANGASQAYTIYGRIPPQSTPAPGVYSDTITVTVTY
jgi:spore coat protein U-like protein